MESSKRNVVIIGGSGGLGKELAKAFLHNGDRVAVHFHRNRDAAVSLLTDPAAGSGKTGSFACQADIREEPSVREMFDTIRHQWKQIHVLINNAGVLEDALLSRMTERQWNESLQANLSGIFYCMKYGGRIMLENNGGHIINIGSLSGLTGRIGQSNYSAAKAGVIGLTRSAAREWGVNQIQVNAVLPGFLPTSMGGSMVPKKQNQMIGENVLKRPSTLPEVSRFIYFLSLMKHVSGQVFQLDSRIA